MEIHISEGTRTVRISAVYAFATGHIVLAHVQSVVK